MDLADIVHDAIEQPLAVDFALAAQRETVESACARDIGKHGLRSRQPPGINEAAEEGVDLALHLLRVGLGRALGSTFEETHLPGLGALRVLEAAAAQLTRQAIAFSAVELDRLVTIDHTVPAIAVEPLSRRTDASECGLVVDEIGGLEQTPVVSF